MGRMVCNLTPEQALEQAGVMAKSYLCDARKVVTEIWGDAWVKAHPMEAATMMAGVVQAAGANFQSLVMMSISGEGR